MVWKFFKEIFLINYTFLKSILISLTSILRHAADSSIYSGQDSKVFVTKYPPKQFNLCSTSEIRLQCIKRKTLVLDLDETLVHSTIVGTHQKCLSRSPDLLLWLIVEKQPHRFSVYKRPYVDYFLSVVSEWYDLVTFTASLKDYGSPVIDSLDPSNVMIVKRLYRNDCTNVMGIYTKDLKIINPDLSSIIIIDNSPNACQMFPENVIPIISWHGEDDDTALLDVLPFLDALRFTHDVRNITKNTKFKEMFGQDGRVNTSEYSF